MGHKKYKIKNFGGLDKMWGGINARKFPRVKYDCHVILKYGKQPKQFKTHTENIGPGGICVILNTPLDIFSQVGVKIMFQNGKTSLECIGRIVWIVKSSILQSNGAKDIFDVGIEFVNLSDENKNRIETIIDSLKS